MNPSLNCRPAEHSQKARGVRVKITSQVKDIAMAKI